MKGLRVGSNDALSPDTTQDTTRFSVVVLHLQPKHTTFPYLCSLRVTTQDTTRFSVVVLHLQPKHTTFPISVLYRGDTKGKVEEDLG